MYGGGCERASTEARRRPQLPQSFRHLGETWLVMMALGLNSSAHDCGARAHCHSPSLKKRQPEVPQQIHSEARIYLQMLKETGI